MLETDLYKKSEFQRGLLQIISKSIFDFIAVIREDQKIVFVNEMGARLFGYENPDDLLFTYAPSLRKNYPDSVTLERISREIGSKGHFADEVEYVTKDGAPFWGHMQQTFFTVGDQDYRLLQIEKIDRAKSAEASLMQEKQRFGALMEYASIGVVIINEQLQIVLMNNYTSDLFGYQKEELAGKEIQTLIPPRYHQQYTTYLFNYLNIAPQRQTTAGKDVYAFRKNKTEFPVEIGLGHFQTDKESFAILFINDITVRKKDENEIKKLNAQLEQKVKERTEELKVTISKLEHQIKETEKARAELERVMQFQKAVLDSSGALIVSTNAKGTINLFNKAAENMLGYKADDIIGKHDPSYFHDKEETLNRAIKYSGELKKDISPGFEVYVAKSRNNQPNKNEWTYVKKDGTRFPVSLSITAFRNSHNEITGFLGVAVDISHTKKTEHELTEALAREKQLNDMKSKFVSIASHEFRTPLSTILSSTYLLQKYVNTDEQPKREKHIDRIVSSVNLLTDILNDLLNVGKIEEGKVVPKFALFNPKQHIEKSISEVGSIRKKGQQISFTHHGKKQVWLDPSFLTHIVTNLLSNAIKFSPEDSCIKVESEATNAVLRLRVKDQGIGIPVEEQQHLFERFFRGANAANIQGTGLGLHIVQKYAELMNGEISCISEIGKGTEFFLEFKLTDL